MSEKRLPLSQEHLFGICCCKYTFNQIVGLIEIVVCQVVGLFEIVSYFKTFWANLSDLVENVILSAEMFDRLRRLVSRNIAFQDITDFFKKEEKLKNVIFASMLF